MRVPDQKRERWGYAADARRWPALRSRIASCRAGSARTNINRRRGRLSEQRPTRVGTCSRGSTSEIAGDPGENLDEVARRADRRRPQIDGPQVLFAGHAAGADVPQAAAHDASRSGLLLTGVRVSGIVFKIAAQGRAAVGVVLRNVTGNELPGAARSREHRRRIAALRPGQSRRAYPLQPPVGREAGGERRGSPPSPSWCPPSGWATSDLWPPALARQPSHRLRERRRRRRSDQAPLIGLATAAILIAMLLVLVAVFGTTRP